MTYQPTSGILVGLVARVVNSSGPRWRNALAL